VIIIAHRGSTGPARPENTIAAAAAAFDRGADAVEVDLRLTSDGVLALSHDPDLSRLTGLRLEVGTTTWPVLRDAAARRGLRLARVEELLALSGGRRVVLEMKTPPPRPDEIGRAATALVDRVCLLAEAGLALDVTVSSFSAALLAAVRDLSPPSTLLRTALLGEPEDRGGSLLSRALDGGHDEMHPHVVPLLRDPCLVDDAHRLGVAVVPWTVNRRRDVRRLDGLHVDGVITDIPATARASVARVAA
jgi:glycerophosphoryl diester phosphodiesterase